MSRAPKPTAPKPAEERAPREAVKTVNLALQGGGSHGAYTWGALDALAEDARIEISAISGASAGTMNAVVFASGMAKGDGRAPARSWRNSGSRSRRKARSPPFSADGSTRRFRPGAAFGRRSRWIDAWTETMSGLLSPYEFNPFNVNPLRVHLEQAVDFERLRATDGVKLFIAATNVRTGRGEIFRRDILTADHAMASACLPQLFQAVIIKGEPYWDGGFAGNPPLWPLFYETRCRDAIIVQINPIERDETPRLPGEIAIGSMRSLSTRASWRSSAPPTLSPVSSVRACSRAMNTGRSGCIASAARASSNPSTPRPRTTCPGRSSSNCATSDATTPRNGSRRISTRSASKARSTWTRPCSASRRSRRRRARRRRRGEPRPSAASGGPALSANRRSSAALTATVNFQRLKCLFLSRLRDCAEGRFALIAWTIRHIRHVYRRLPVLELGRSLLDEGAHAFLLVLGREQRMEDAALEAHAFGERRLVGAVDDLLGGVDRRRATKRRSRRRP